MRLVASAPGLPASLDCAIYFYRWRDDWLLAGMNRVLVARVRRAHVFLQGLKVNQTILNQTLKSLKGLSSRTGSSNFKVPPDHAVTNFRALLGAGSLAPVAFTCSVMNRFNALGTAEIVRVP